jgi:hypothetical protein
MKRLDPELEAFLQPRNIEPHAPADVRARALARARAIIAAGPAISRTPTFDLALAPPAHARQNRGKVWIALAAALAVAGGAVGAAAALRARAAARASQAAPPAVAALAPAARDRRLPGPPTEAAPATVERAAAASPARRPRTTAETDPITAELELVQRAHAAYTRRDFPIALALAAEHARRFPSGHLAEQREALRVRSLFGAGRADEARRAATAFRVHFPRSVLLPRVEDGP